MRGCCIRHPWEPAYWLQRKPGCRLRTSRFVETSIASLLNGGQVWKKEVDVTTFLKDIIVVVVIVVVVVIACGINRVFVAHNLTSDRGYATHHLRLCQWVIWCQIPVLVVVIVVSCIVLWPTLPTLASYPYLNLQPPPEYPVTRARASPREPIPQPPSQDQLLQGSNPLLE